MYLLATTAAEKLHTIPIMVWVKFGLVIVGFVIAVIILKKVLELNRAMVLTVAFVLFALLFLTWVQTRTEPKFMTPIVDWVAQFAPTGKALEPPKLEEPGTTPTPKKK